MNKIYLLLRKNFKDKLLRKALAFVMLLFFNFNIFSEIVPDPASIGTKVTKTASGIEQIDIAAPNKNGTSYNSLKELQVSEQGLILNNNKHVAINTQTAGLVARNRNLDNGVAANLIITEVTGKNRTNINGIVEVAGQRADLVMANRNGIYVNGGGFLNTDRVTLTTGSLQMKDGDLVAIDVSQGHIGIGEKGVDALSLTDLELLGKTIDIAGVIKASKETRVLVSSGGQTYEYRTKEVKSKGETYRGIAVDGKAAGSMYAGKIDIISNDKGAGVNTKGDLVSVDDITLTANGDITTNKVNAGKQVTYKSTKKVRMKGETTAGKKVQVKAKETEIDAKIVTGYLEKALGEKAIEIESEKTSITSKIEANGRVEIKSKETRNTGEILATEKIEVTGNKLNNNSGEIRSNSKIDINVKDTSNVKGYILSDGITKEQAKEWQVEEKVKEESKEDKKEENKEQTTGINLKADRLDNTKGIIASLGKTAVNAGGIVNKDGKIVSKGVVELITPNEYVYEGTVAGDYATTLNAKKITVNEKMERKNTLELIAEQGVILKENIVSRILSIETKGNLDNAKEIKGTATLVLKADNIENKGNLLSDKNLYIKANGKVLNTETGLIKGKEETYVEAGIIENNRGKILSEGNLALIAETLIRNDRGKLHARGDVYGEVRNGHFENIGETGITTDGNVIIKAEKGDVTNKDGGNIEAGKGVSITAKNLYNTERYITDGKDSVILAGGGRIKGSDVYIDVKGKVVNGTEEYEKGTNRRKDGVLVDNRNVTALNPSIIGGTNSTAIKGGNLVNTSQIGITGTTQIELTGKGINASIGNNTGKINGNIVLVEGNKGIRNIGGEIKGGEATQVTSKEGKILNESTVTTDISVITNENAKRKWFVPRRETVSQTSAVTETIRNVGKIEGDNLVYVKGAEVENIAGDIKGKGGTYIKSTSKDITDKTITLEDNRKGAVEAGTDKKQWDTIDKTNTVSGIIGEGKDTILDSARDIILESSNLRAKDDIVLNAKNYLMMLSTVDTEHKFKTQSSTSGGGLFRKKKRKTEVWTEDNIYANPVELTNDGNVLINYRGIGKPAENMGVFAQGVNFKTKGQIVGLSDGNIYIQGTKDRLESTYDSKTVKSFWGFKYKRIHDYVNEDKENYKHSQLYGEAGVKIDSEGKLKIEGADIQAVGSVFLRGKLGLEVMPGTEVSSKYEKHTNRGLRLANIMVGLKDFFTGRKDMKDKLVSKSIGTVINSKEGSITVEGDYIISVGSKIGAAGDINLLGVNGVLLKDGENFESLKELNEKMKTGTYGRIGGKNWSGSFGAEGYYTRDINKTTIKDPEKNIFVTNGSIYIKSSEGNIQLQGDLAAKQNIGISAEKGKISIIDSQRKVLSKSENISAQTGFTVNATLGGIKDTILSYKDYLKMVTEMRNMGKVTSLIKDIAEGKSLLESLDGKEETLNTLNTYLKGPSSGGVSAGVTAAGAGSYGKTVNEYIQSIATNLRAGNDITLKSNELELYGGVVKGDHDVSLEAKKINVNASEDSYISNMKNIASAGNYDIFSRRGGGSINYGRGKGEGQSYNNSEIIAGNRLYSKSDELIVQGGNLQGKHTDVITKSLVLETLQDTEKNREIGVGVAFNSERQNSKNSYSGNAELLTVKRNKEWSENQSSITGTESIKVKADNGYIKGGVIANIDKNGKDGGNLSVNIKKLITEDIESKDNKLGAGVSAGVTKRAKVPATEQMVIKDANGNSIVKQNKFGMDFSGSVEGFKKEKITKATIGSGILITEEQSGPINRNINDMEQITKNVNVNKVNMNYTETKRGWGEIGAILAADAGIIGGIADSINEKWFRNQPQNMEEAWTETVYRKIRNVEDFIDKKLKNDMLPIIPTSGQYGGVLEGIQVFGIKDKFDIFDIVLKQDENGNVIITGKKLHNPSEIKSNEVFLNGMTEESEVSIRNAISQLVSINDIENKIKKGKEVNVTLVYSKTRGNITDGMESVLGKMFDGTLATFGLVTGTSRGFADVLTQLNPDRQYNITTYSQGNIVAMGGLNYLNNKGIKLNGNITFYHTGTPVAPKVFDKLSKEMNFKNGVSMINSLDPVGSEHGGFIGIKRFGLIAETKDYNGKANKTLDQLSSKIFVFGPSLMRSQAYPMLTLKQKDEYTKEEIRRLSKRQILDDNFWGFVTYPHGRYFKEDREFVQRQLDYLNLVKANGGTADNKIIDNIRKERQTVTVEKFINGPIVSDDQIIDFRTNLFYDEFKENLGAHWIEKEKPLLPKLEIGASKIQSRRNSTESIDVIVERLRKQVK